MTSKSTSPRLLGVSAVAERLGLSEKTIWRLVERGELRVHRLGRAVRVSEADLAAYLNGCRR